MPLIWSVYLVGGSYCTLTITKYYCRHYQLYLVDRDTELLDTNLDFLGKIENELELLRIGVTSQPIH